jgi:Methyltransferase domain
VDYTSETNFSLFSHTRPILKQAELLAEQNKPLEVMLDVLRKLSLEDFGLLLISMPNSRYPSLSKVLPKMADAAIQQQWTGITGLELFSQTAAFARQLETAFVRFVGRPLQGSNILDLGVGYGRNMRSMLYYSNPDKLWGVDPWQSSLDLSINDGVLAHLVRSDPIPETLPVKGTKFDLAFAFSVFTHLSQEAVIGALKAVRKSIEPDGIFVCTIRPIEYWSVKGQLFTPEQSKQAIDDHREHGFGFYAHEWSDGSYGDTSIDLRFFERDGWTVAGYDTTVSDTYQIAVILKAV